MSDEKTQALLDKFSAFKDELAAHFEDLGFGKDVLLRVHAALDEAHAVVASHKPVEGYDLNVDLAEKPEDHPAVQGHVPTPINTDDDVNQASPVDPAVAVVSGAPTDAADDPEQRVGSDDEPHAPLPG